MIRLRLIQLRHVAGKLLAQRQGTASCRWVRPILTMSANASGSVFQRCAQDAPAPAAVSAYAQAGGHMHRGGENVVGRLAEIDVIVGVHLPGFATSAAEQFRGTIGEHLVQVHVGLGAGARLPDGQGKLFRVAACQHFIGGLHDGCRLVRIQQAQVAVDERAGALDRGECKDELLRHVFGGNMKMLERTLGLRAPETLSRDLDGAERVVLGSGRGHEFLPIEESP